MNFILRAVVAAVTLTVLTSQPCFIADEDIIINRSSFPNGFVFGTASSAFQFEGAVKADGRGPTIWDKFSHTFGKIADFSNADNAVDQYHRYKEDIELMKDIGMDAYRFSIAWSRIFPNGSGIMNQAGVDHYNNLINALIAKGIEPYVTLYHWDLPQALQDRYIGWLDPQIIKDYARFAETCFEKFGDRVKKWITFNEPHNFVTQGYDQGLQPPGRCSIIGGLICKDGNSATEPYVVAHHVLLSHAKAVHLYRNKYLSQQRGSIGHRSAAPAWCPSSCLTARIVTNLDTCHDPSGEAGRGAPSWGSRSVAGSIGMSFDVKWYEPASNIIDDIEATQRGLDFQFGWFIEPLIFGDYPSSMRARVGSRLPKFSEPESTLLKGSLDFVGINHYTTYYTRANMTRAYDDILNDTIADSGVISSPFKNLRPIGERAGSIWLYIVPHGIRSLMNYIKNKYNNPQIIITENGVDELNNPLRSMKDALKDQKRIKYHKDYLLNLLAAIKEDQCNVQGYFVWSLMDNWEWQVGYTSRFGLYYVDYKHNLTRHAKDSVQWFKNLLAR